MKNSVNICNAALTRLGADQIITLDENTRNAQLCNAQFDHLRKLLQETGYFAFCTKRAIWDEPSSVVGDPAWQYANAYVIPPETKVLRMQQPRTDCNPYEYPDIEWAEESGKALCDANPVYVTMVEEISTPLNFPHHFTEVLVSRLAAEICIAITQSQNMHSLLYAEYERRLEDAKFSDNNYRTNMRGSAYRRPEPVGRLTSSRFGGGYK